MVSTVGCDLIWIQSIWFMIDYDHVACSVYKDFSNHKVQYASIEWDVNSSVVK